MNALMNGRVVPYTTALEQRKREMKRLGITQPRVRIGAAYQPPAPVMSYDMERVQSALLRG